MTKRILFPILLFFSLLFSNELFAVCNNTYFTTNQAGNTVTFNASVPAGCVINTYYWTFGDGGTSNTASPTHTYANGIYGACMVISGVDSNNIGFQCTYCDSIYIGNNPQPCNASFISTVSGNTVTFTNTANGPGVITGYAWTFGDGGISNLPNPVHTYANNGFYNACLTITGIDNGQTYTCTWCDSVTVGNNVNPCNNIYYITSQVGNAIVFSISAPVGYNFNTYAWNFGDGGTSNAASPSHTYANNGWYYACVTVTGYAANTPISCTICDSVYVGNNPQPCNASFVYTTSGLNAAFTNTATGPGVITAYDWTFGDGGSSTQPNPSHTYANSGWYNVCLTITGVDSNIIYMCTWCDSIYVQAGGGNPCNSISFTALTAGNTVSFTANVPAGFVPNAYNWTFGDGGTSNLASPSHTYANNGWYLTCLVISGIYNNTMVTCTFCDSVYAGNGNPQPCNASFIKTVSGNTVAFTNTATGPGVITGYTWTFGDGGISNLPNPTHTYANSGWYNVCLTITGVDNGLTYSCTWCDSLFVQAGGNPCNGVSFNKTQAGNVVTFNPVVPAGYVVNTYYWTFGDGGTSNTANPSHTYGANGWYNVCMSISGMANNQVPFQCTVCDSIQITAAGLYDIDVNNTLNVYPNPAANYLEVTLPAKNAFTLRVYDVAGKLLEEKRIHAGNEKYTLHTEGLSKGMYFIQLVSDNKKYQTNFVKQ